MDEFSSALDAETEELIYKNLSKEFKQKTLITISHRENIIKNSDVILNMFKGNFPPGKSNAPDNGNNGIFSGNSENLGSNGPRSTSI